MSKSNTTENDLMKLILNATALPWAAAANLYVALHTADPGEGGDQTTNECAYTGYGRVSVSRDGAGWTVAGNQGENTAEITFGECTAGTETATHASVGLAISGASQILYSGALTDALNISNLITPRFPVGTLVMQED